MLKNLPTTADAIVESADLSDETIFIKKKKKIGWILSNLWRLLTCFFNKNQHKSKDQLIEVIYIYNYRKWIVPNRSKYKFKREKKNKFVFKRVVFSGILT